MTTRRPAGKRRGVRFTGELEAAGGGGHFVAVPDRVVKALGGGGRIPVKATFNAIPYRGSIVRMGGPAFVPVLKAIIAEAGVAIGDTLDVVVERDVEVRTIDPPPDLKKALVKSAAANAAWEKLSFTRKREVVQALEAAKQPETRTRRLRKAMDDLAPED